jgi:hypothetical protein
MTRRSLPWAWFWLVCAACSSETHASERRREASYPGGYRIEVVKKDSYTRYKGLITGHDYGTRHEYSYEFELSPGRIHWQGGAAEPRTLIVCPEQIYLGYLDIELEERDAGLTAPDAGSPSLSERVMKVVARHARLRDERYLFKLLGELHWINAAATELPAANECRAFDVPNDHELELGRPVREP